MTQNIFSKQLTFNFGGNIGSWVESYGRNSLELKISVGSDVKAFLQQASPIEQILVLFVSSSSCTLAINCDRSHSSVKVLNPSIIGLYPVHLHRLPRKSIHYYYYTWLCVMHLYVNDIWSTLSMQSCTPHTCIYIHSKCITLKCNF